MSVKLSLSPVEDEKDISVTFKGISLSNTNWTIQDFNLFIVGSDLPNVNLFLKARLSTQTYARNIDIVNSTFGHLNIRGGYNIHVSDCTVDGSTVTSNSTLLDVVGGSLSVSHSSFQHLTGGVSEGPGLLRAVRSSIHMVDVNCSNNKVPSGLIQIQNGSELFLQNSTFKNKNNGHALSPSSVISVKFISSLSISCSVFSGNAASNGSCLRLGHNVSVTINQSTFVNNKADYGGAIYQSCEPENTCGQNHNYKLHSLDFTRSNFSSEGKRQQSLSIHDSYFLNNNASTKGGVVYLDGASIVLFVKKCEFTENYAFDSSGVIHAKSLSGTVVLEQCLFTNNSVIRYNGDSLSLIGTHSQLMSCEFFGDSGYATNSTLDFQYGTSFIYDCTFSEEVFSSIKALSTKLNITDNRFNGHKEQCFILLNCEITIIGCQFAVSNNIFYDTDFNWSNLTVINTLFTHGQSVFASVFTSGQVQFINCLFQIQAGYIQIGHMFFKNCTISNLKEQFIHSNQFESPDFANPTGPVQLDIVDCVFMENNVSDDQPFIYVENASFTMINCLYTENYVWNHILLNGTTDVTITNVTFFNNSFAGMDDPENEKSIFIVNNTVIKIDNCNFESNYVPHGSLMLVFGSEVRVTNSVMSDNYNTYWPMISIRDSKTVEFSSSKFMNNSLDYVFDVQSSNLLLIVNCLFEITDDSSFYSENTYDVILQRSTFYSQNFDAIGIFFAIGYFKDVNNLRIFRCTFPSSTDMGFDDGNVRPKVFLLDSDVTVYGVDRKSVTEGSPYASGGY